jgi:hypothetical protein
MNNIIQLKLSLDHTEPPIWRRVLVEKEISFDELHEIIQIVMGWDNYHLYEFNINGCKISEAFEDDMDFGVKIIDSSSVTLDEFINGSKIKFKYLYDFGDGWEHSIKVEKFLNKDENLFYPICIDGELNCPPEDCGGVWGFYNLLEVIKNKKHPEHKETLEWLGEKYDALAFDKDEVNKVFKPVVKKPKSANKTATKKATKKATKTATKTTTKKEIKAATKTATKKISKKEAKQAT